MKPARLGDDCEPNEYQTTNNNVDKMKATATFSDWQWLKLLSLMSYRYYTLFRWRTRLSTNGIWWTSNMLYGGGDGCLCGGRFLLIIVEPQVVGSVFITFPASQRFLFLHLFFCFLMLPGRYLYKVLLLLSFGSERLLVFFSFWAAFKCFLFVLNFVCIFCFSFFFLLLLMPFQFLVFDFNSVVFY